MRHGEPPLPKLHDVVLDEAEVGTLFASIEAEGTDVEVQVKADVTRHASRDAVGLADARALLEAGEVVGVQIRYRVGAIARLDTLMHVPHGVRLVRMDAPWTEGDSDRRS